MSSIVVSAVYAAKIVQMKKDGLAGFVKNLILIDPIEPDVMQEAVSVGLEVY